MRRLRWPALGLALALAGLWFLGKEPREYFLRQECSRYHEERKARYHQLTFQRARGGAAAAPDIDRRMNELLSETRTFSVRGWEVVLVPAGALPPARDHARAATFDPSVPADPPALKGPMSVWTRPRGLLARLLAPG